MNVDQEVADYQAAGALAEEIPYWGWLDDGRTCLTRAGELLCLARLTPAVLDGRTPKQLDAVLNRWQRMLSGADSRTRIYFYLFRRASHFDPGEQGEQSTVAAISQRKRRGFSEQPRSRNPDLHCLDLRPPPFIRLEKAARIRPGGSPTCRTGLPAGATLTNRFICSPRLKQPPARFRQLVDASCALVSDLTPARAARCRRGIKQC